MKEPLLYCWGIKKPETAEESKAYIRELYGAKDDLEEMGFISKVKVGHDNQPPVLMAHVHVLTKNL